MTNRKVTKLVITDVCNYTHGNTSSCVVDVTPNFNTANRCMYCTLITNNVIGCPIYLIPKHIDIKHNNKQSSNEYMTYGTFCSYNCAKAFAQVRESDPLFSNSSRYLSIIVSKEQGELIDIVPSPPIELMIAYGGYMTEEQYRTEIGKIKYTANGTTVMHPLTLVYCKSIK